MSAGCDRLMRELTYGWEYRACLDDIINLASKHGMNKRERCAFIGLLNRVAQYTFKLVVCHGFGD